MTHSGRDVQLRQVIEWNRFTRKLIELYKGMGVVGRLPFDPALVLKVEPIAYLYKLTERQVEVYINENLPAKFFVGVGVGVSVGVGQVIEAVEEKVVKL